MASELLLDTGALVSLLDRSQKLHRQCREFFASWRGPVVSTEALVKKYSDLPMDFADATLVVLAEELGTDLVFTTDYRDFGVYRAGGKRRFQILPPQEGG